MGIRAMIERFAGVEIVVLNEFSTGIEVLAGNGDKPADVYILDIYLPGIDGIETAARLMDHNRNAKTILFTRTEDKTTIQRAFIAGVDGYVLKQAPPQELIGAIEKVYKGYRYISPAIASYVDPDNDESEQVEQLTDRERIVFKLVCDGLTERKIAEQLGISINTVHVHKSNLMKKLDIHSKAGLIMYGLRERLIPPVG
jgi:two-component system NarL family response regulator